MDVILASASPRRKELLGGIVKNFIVLPSNADENVSCLNPLETAKQLSFIKAKSVFEQNQNCLVIGADTIVVHDDKILGKPKDREDAYNMLKALSGRVHSVFTGVCIIENGKSMTFAEETQVEFLPLSDEDIYKYIDTNDCYDKAGAYGIQGYASKFIRRISGDYFNVVGLPISAIFEKFLQKAKNND